MTDAIVYRSMAFAGWYALRPSMACPRPGPRPLSESRTSVAASCRAAEVRSTSEVSRASPEVLHQEVGRLVVTSVRRDG